MSIVPTNGGKKPQALSTTVIPQNHQFYLDARQKAYDLEEKLEDAQYECIQEIQKLVTQIQQKYLLTYENEIEDLSRLKEDIRHLQEKGRLSLVKKLNNIYREGKNPSCEEVRDQVKTLVKEYKEIYFPNDAYQQKIEKQALSLRNAVLGRFTSYGGGGGNHVMGLLHDNDNMSISDDDE